MKPVWQKIDRPIWCLAPMEGVTDSAFRQVINQAGRPNLSFTEFTSVDGLVSRGFDYVAQRLKFTPGEKPLIAQIWGINPDNFYIGAKMVAKMGFDGIDINMACPVKAVVSKGGGAALIRTPALAEQIIKETKRGAGGLPVSVKTRMGYDGSQVGEWLNWLLTQDLAAITIHGRTAKQMSRGRADWGAIAKVVRRRNEQNYSTLIIGNGDVTSLSQAQKRVAETGVDGVMIGRGVLHNPWVFAGEAFNSKAKAEKLGLLREHVRLFELTWQGQKPWVVLRKYFKIYCRGFVGAKALMKLLMEVENGEEFALLIGKIS